MKCFVKILLASAFLISCQSKRKPNYEYFPNMYESVAYEAYSSHDIFSDNNGSEALQPVSGTVHRGWLPYDYENSPKGYSQAKSELKNPLAYTKENAEKGKVLYDIYCAICHGTKGDGKGTLVQREKILGVPSYDDPGRKITEGSIYHVMYYGINSMGSYASQTSIEERWLITQYVESLKAKLEGKTPRIDSDQKAGLYPVSLKDTFTLQDKVSTTVSNANSTTNHSVSHELDHSVDLLHSSGVKEVISSASKSVNDVVKEVKSSPKASSKLKILGGKSHHSHKVLDQK